MEPLPNCNSSLSSKHINITTWLSSLHLLHRYESACMQTSSNPWVYTCIKSPFSVTHPSFPAAYTHCLPSFLSTGTTANTFWLQLCCLSSIHVCSAPQRQNCLSYDFLAKKIRGVCFIYYFFLEQMHSYLILYCEYSTLHKISLDSYSWPGTKYQQYIKPLQSWSYLHLQHAQFSHPLNPLALFSWQVNVPIIVFLIMWIVPWVCLPEVEGKLIMME